MGNIIIFIGYEKATIKIKISSKKTVYQLKHKIFEKIGIEESSQTLFFNGKELLDSKMLSFFNINNNSKINLIVNSQINSLKQKNNFNYKLTKLTDEVTKAETGIVSKREEEETPKCEINDITKGETDEISIGIRDEKKSIKTETTQESNSEIKLKNLKIN